MVVVVVVVVGAVLAVVAGSVVGVVTTVVVDAGSDVGDELELVGVAGVLVATPACSSVEVAQPVSITTATTRAVRHLIPFRRYGPAPRSHQSQKPSVQLVRQDPQGSPIPLEPLATDLSEAGRLDH